MEKQKLEKGGKAVDIVQLKKNLSNAAKALQAIIPDVNSVEAGLIASEEASANELRLKDQISNLQNEVKKLEDLTRKQQESLGNTVIDLKDDFDRRIAANKEKYEKEIREERLKHLADKKSLSNELRSEKVKNKVRQDNEDKALRDHENKAREAEDSRAQTEAQLRGTLERKQNEFQELEERFHAVSTKCDDLNTIRKGKEKETALLTRRLREIEAYEVIPLEKLQGKFKEIQSSLEAFCVQCVEKADFLPELNRVPNYLRKNTLPQQFSNSTTVGRAFIASLLQGSVVDILLKHVFLSAPFSEYPGIESLSDFLCRNDHTHEALWRSIMARTVLRYSQILKFSSTRLQKISEELLTLWSVFDDALRPQMQAKLVAILLKSVKLWYQVLCMQEKVYVVHDGASQYFHSDSPFQDPEHSKVPGEFENCTRGDPVICLFPAFLSIVPDERILQPRLVYAGTAYYNDSLAISNVVKENEQLASPQLSNRRFSISSKDRDH